MPNSIHSTTQLITHNTSTGQQERLQSTSGKLNVAVDNFTETNSATIAGHLQNIYEDLVQTNRAAEVSMRAEVDGELAASSDLAAAVDLGTYKNIRFYGTADERASIHVLQSMDNSNFYLMQEYWPVNYGGKFHYNINLENCLKYVKVVNGTTAATFDIQHTRS